MAELLCDPAQWQERPLLHDLAAVHERIPQRHEMGLLHGVVFHDPHARLAIGIHQSTGRDFWVRGHVPGRPLMPGVVMVEISAQLCAWTASFDLPTGGDHFMGFGGIDKARFRGQVVPGDKLVVASRILRMRRNLASFQTQAFVGTGLVFEGEILGVIL